MQVLQTLQGRRNGELNEGSQGVGIYSVAFTIQQGGINLVFPQEHQCGPSINNNQMRLYLSMVSVWSEQTFPRIRFKRTTSTVVEQTGGGNLFININKQTISLLHSSILGLLDLVDILDLINCCCGGGLLFHDKPQSHICGHWWRALEQPLTPSSRRRKTSRLRSALSLNRFDADRRVQRMK